MPIVEKTYDAYINFSRVNSTYTPSAAERTLPQLKPVRLVSDLVGTPVNDAFSGTLCDGSLQKRSPDHVRATW